MEHGPTFEGNLARAADRLDAARAGGAQLVLLPEYFFVEATDEPEAAAQRAFRLRRFFEEESARTGLSVGGNLVERRPEGLVNLGVVAERGRIVLEQVKVHPMPREAAGGIVPGPRFGVGQVAGRATGLLVCADVLYPEAARVLALQGAEVLLNPVMSPWRESDMTKDARDALFVARAYDAGAFLLKAGGWRRNAIAGRSLVTAPWGVLARYRDDFEETLLFADLDFEKLRAFRKGQQGFPPRQPGAYRDLL